jgi:molecular chaperone DnaK (HSP70)
VDGQRNVLIHVVQGERERAQDNRSLARFDLKGIAPMPAGTARIEVRFLIDANGILNVTARDERTSVEHSVEVKPSYGLTDEQVEAMIEASIDHAEDDFRAAQLVEARASAETILTATAKAKNNAAYGVLDSAERGRIETAIAELRTEMSGDDPHAISAKVELLNQATQHLAETIMNFALKGMLKGTRL